MRVRALILPIVLASCSAAAPAEPSQSPDAAATPSAKATPPVAATPEDLPPLQAQLPSQLGSVELHTFAVGQEILERLAANLRVAPNEIEAAYASEHGARFLQMYAIRHAGSPASSLATAWAAVAYPPDESDVSVTQEMIDGRTVTVVHAPSAAARLGTFYLLPRDETLFVVQAFDGETAEEALAALR